jgi:AcrR family transcriptional regulator
MPQLQKDHVRQAILGAARRRFAEHGVKGAALATIAADAGTSIGNLYKYFADKDELFVAAVPPELVQQLRGLLREQVESLGTERDTGRLASDHPYRRAAARSLAFSIEHRWELLMLLRHCAGTDYDSFVDDVVGDLTRLATSYARKAYPAFPVGAANARALRRIYRAWVVSIADILAEEHSARALGEATQKLTVYHLAGLRAFFITAAAAASREDHS